MQAWSSFGCWVGNEVAWQHGASAATVSAWIILLGGSANQQISKFSPSAPRFEKIFFSRNKLTTAVRAGMKLTPGEKRRDYRQVTFLECVSVSITLLLVFASHIGIEYHNYIELAQGSREQQDTVTEIKGTKVLLSTTSWGTSMSTSKL